LVVNGAKAGIGWLQPSVTPLILLPIIGNAVHAIVLFLQAVFLAPRSGQAQLIQWKSLFTLAKRYRDFPLYRAPQVFINAISHNLPVLMLASLFGSSAAGFYSIGRSVMGLPASVIGKSVGDVFYSHIARAAHEGKNLTHLILKATLLLAVVGFLPFALVVAFGPQLFAFAFGNEWVAAGEYARWLSLWLFFAFINRPSVVSIPVLGLQKGLVVYEIFSTLSKVIAIYVGFMIFGSDKLAVAAFSVFGTIAYIILIAWVLLSSMNPKADV
jgi:O-antigen/teichoic acid export membrane protein